LDSLELTPFPSPIQERKEVGSGVYQDKVLLCRDCGQEFVFSSGEQEFFASRGFANEPSRCPDCRAQRRASSRQGTRSLYRAVCSSCGGEARVPFRPTSGRPVYCSACFSAQRA
jgi:CxxC-x17-CxxC domain-containing protein